MFLDNRADRWCYNRYIESENDCKSICNKEADMKRIGFYLIMIIGMMLCWGCGDHKITESTETEAGLPEYKMAQLDMAQICEFGKVQDEYVCIGEADNGGYIRLTGKAGWRFPAGRT